MPLDDDARRRAAETKRERTREAIREATWELFFEEPIATLTYATVAKRAGVSEATIYRYFPTKSDLVLAAVGDKNYKLELDPRGWVRTLGAQLIRLVQLSEPAAAERWQGKLREMLDRDGLSKSEIAELLVDALLSDPSEILPKPMPRVSKEGLEPEPIKRVSTEGLEILD